jgi:hypothetical protein
MAHPWRIRSRSALSAGVRIPTLTSHYGSRRSVKIRLWGIRDAEVAGSNPAFPTSSEAVCFIHRTTNVVAETVVNGHGKSLSGAGGRR